MSRRHPEVLWAHLSDRVYLTVALPDAKDISIKVVKPRPAQETSSAPSRNSTKVGGSDFSRPKKNLPLTLRLIGTISTSDLASDDDAANVGEDDGSSDDEGMLYLPDLEKARKK